MIEWEGGFPDAGTVTGLLFGTVLENSNSQMKGTLKVRLGSEGETQNILEGVKLMSPYGGSTHGAYLMPEVGSQVVVGFLDGCFSRPVVLGCLYTKTDQMVADSFHKSNALKRFLTKGGTLVEFCDEDGGEAVTIRTKGKLSVTMREKEQTLLLTTGKNQIKLDEKAGSIQITAEKELRFTCGSSDIKLESSGVVQVNGKTVKVKGSKLELNSSGVLAVKGQKTDISGAIVEVKSDGLMTVKGSVTKIN